LVVGLGTGANVEATGAVVEATGAGVDTTGAVVEATGDDVDVTGALVLGSVHWPFLHIPHGIE